ncbi:ETC complex I subunit conserved region-domain-containing protein [Hypoxylon trugodes]|uniref:ETC complex I subunit conserved region-domain-containing protein n=1 Tax=Hypoxylon trugodes TaxID=326681 RepID=UPI00218D3D51|nr:ETC complex I subunit conserved region-domain-containing protein [Hypoxylon trugodes]KAI1394050.1 ETC complex I subunit conserved region-domain-containing protein [Hypoxylon trugodes]
MRRTFQLLAAVKPAARYLESGTPTGLTGLLTHNSPRSTLLYLYSSTLEKLKPFPESSLYRQSIEAVTKHRMSIVEAAEPPGYKEWAAQAKEIVEKNPQKFRATTSALADHPAKRATVLQLERNGHLFIHRHNPRLNDERFEEWDGERDEGPGTQGLKGEKERVVEFERFLEREELNDPRETVKLEAEPQLTAEQIEEIENKIGHGLIEEVVRTAENELQLVDIMYESKVWEDLEEKPAEGQWTYFERHSQ